MAHEITATDGIVLNRKKAWHGLGTVIGEDFGPREALQYAGLDWRIVSTTGVAGVTGDGAIFDSKDYRMIVREDTAETFGVFKDFSPMQNADLFEAAYALGADVKVESAGSLFGGRRVFLLIRGETIHATDNDSVKTYFCLVNGHDGSLTLRAFKTGVRVVCNNTLSMALGEKQKAYVIRHVGDMKQKVEYLKVALEQFKLSGDMFKNKVDFLSSRQIGIDKLLPFWEKCYTDYIGKPTNSKELQDSKDVLVKLITDLDIEKMTLGQDEVTPWLAANTFTAFIQHTEPARKIDGWEDRKLESNWFGTRFNATNAVMDAALSIF